MKFKSSLRKNLINLKLKVFQNRWPLLIFIFYLGFGLIYYTVNFPDSPTINIIEMAIAAREPPEVSDFTRFYVAIWAVLIAQAIFGFIINGMLSAYNPNTTCQILAKQQRNHTIVIHYGHMGVRIIKHLKESDLPYVVIEDDEELVEDLVNEITPTIIGDPVETVNLENAGIKYCKEVFVASNNPREAVLVAYRAREINPNVKLYIQVFDEKIQQILSNPPVSAYTFSVSKWAIQCVEEWSKNWGDLQKTSVIVLGFTHLGRRVAEFFSLIQKRRVYILDIDLDELLFRTNRNVTVIKTDPTKMSNVEAKIDLKEVSQIFVCWKETNEFSDVMLIISNFLINYPQIQQYVRIFDEELGTVLEKMGVNTFSTSKNAFEMLQRDVDKKSAIYSIGSKQNPPKC